MKLIDGTLYIEFADFTEAGWKEDTVKKANLRNGSAWMMIKNPLDARKPLVQFETLVDAHKEKLAAWLRKRNGCKHNAEQICQCGNPYEYVAKQPLRNLYEKDFKAEAFYMAYRFGEDKQLSMEYVAQYTKAASWLNLLLKLNEDKKTIKQTLGLSIDKFYLHIFSIFESDDIDLPTTYQYLRTRMQGYKENGYAHLISKKFGNSNSAKVADAVSENALLALIEHPNQYDDVLVCALYNNWAAKHGYKAIEPATVGNWRRKKEFSIISSRNGSSAFNEKYIRQVKGLAPSGANFLWECDDYNLNFYYSNPNSDSTNKDMHRYVSYVVADSATGLVLGYSYRLAKSPIVEMVKLAWIDAMYYVRSLAGAWYLPFETKADHWQQSVLFPFFESIGNFVPAAHGNKHRGYIEQLFGSPHFKRAEKLSATQQLNYNGNNITAINRGVNVEALHNNRRNRPLVGNQAEAQIEHFFYLCRHMPDITRENLNAPSRQQQWLNNFNALAEKDKRQITDEQFLLTFGIEHKPQGRTIAITNRGVEPQINGVQYSYDLPQNLNMLTLIGKKVTVKYDPYDMSRILVTDGAGFRCVATSAILQPRALHDAHENSRAALNFILQNKMQQVDFAAAKAAMHRDSGIDEEAVMLAPYMPKETKNHIEANAEMVLAQNNTQNQNWAAEQEDFWASKVDFDAYGEDV